MNSLLIETSTEQGISNLYSNENVLLHSALSSGFQHSRYLVSEIEEGLKKAQLSISDLSFIAVGVGPGSYTGVRVGVMVAKAFSFACKTPLVSLSSLEGIVPPIDGPFVAALDAKMSGAYVLFSEKKHNQIKHLSLPEVISLECLSERIVADTLIASPHALILEKKWHEKKLKGSIQFVETEINPHYLIKTAYDRFQKGIVVNDRTIDIRYLRKWE